MSLILIILTDKYPYGNGETYIETERNYWNKFDHVYICPTLIRKEDKIREGFSTMPYETLISTEDRKPRMIEAIKSLFGSITMVDYFQELKELRKSGRLSVSNIKKLLFMGILSNLRIQRIERAIKPLLGKEHNERKLLYSYWMYEPAIVGTGLKVKLKCNRFISRAHRYDIYEELQETGYLPFRELVLRKVDRLYSISIDGKKYFSNHYNKRYDKKIFISRIGTAKKYEIFNGKRGKEIVVVSCSNLIPVKRVHLIVNALSQCEKPISWFHFGDGILRDELENLVKQLPDNVSVHFMGYTPNDDIQKFYSEHYIDAFINVSESEGVPVSIMEAQSYGVPVIATDVGGSREIVFNGENGVLLDADFSINDLLNAIDEVIDKGNFYRDRAKKTWLKKSDSRIICEEFFAQEKLRIDRLTS